MNARVALVLLFALFLLPVSVAWMFYLGIFEFSHEPGEGKNQGELIHPARPLEGLSLAGENAEKIDLNHFLGKWTMIQFIGDQCVEDCKKNVYLMRQIYVALGKDAHRVQRVLITQEPDVVAPYLADNPGIQVFSLTSESNLLLNLIPDYNHSDIASISNRLYIVDPLGNLMMRYPYQTDASGVLKDLRHLLKATWIRPTE